MMAPNIPTHPDDIRADAAAFREWLMRQGEFTPLTCKTYSTSIQGLLLNGTTSYAAHHAALKQYLKYRRENPEFPRPLPVNKERRELEEEIRAYRAHLYLSGIICPELQLKPRAVDTYLKILRKFLSDKTIASPPTYRDIPTSDKAWIIRRYIRWRSVTEKYRPKSVHEIVRLDRERRNNVKVR